MHGGTPEVVWVVGTSAAGKETFVKTAVTHRPVLERMGWLGKKVVYSQQSIRQVGQYKNDPAIARRENILQEVPQLLDHGAEVVLVKWQYVDTQTERLQRLRQLLPEAGHKIVALVAPPDELAGRLAQKPWWDDIGGETARLQWEQGVIDEWLGQLVGFEIVTIGSGAADGYRSIGSV